MCPVEEAANAASGYTREEETPTRYSTCPLPSPHPFEDDSLFIFDEHFLNPLDDQSTRRVVLNASVYLICSADSPQEELHLPTASDTEEAIVK
jgi:hypothetical protein